MSAPVIHIDPETKTAYKLPKLRPCDVIELQAVLHQRDRMRLLTTLDESNVEPAVRLIELKEHDKTRGLFSAIWQSCYTTEGAQEIIERSIAMMNGDKPNVEGFLKDPTDDLHEMAMELIGIDLEAVKARVKAKESEDDLDSDFPKSQGTGT